MATYRNVCVTPDRSAHEAFLAAARDVDPDATNLISALRSAAFGREQYWRKDWHLNPDGHATVAAALLERFRASPPR